MMVPPYSRRHSQHASMNSSRPRSWRDLPSAASFCSTLFCVAMPAWSVPTTHSVGRPVMRERRMTTSWMVLLSAWPMCSEPVTLGGGMTTEYGSTPSTISAEKYPPSCHDAKIGPSTALGSYALGISLTVRRASRGGSLVSVTQF